ncbi:PH domain containing protein [Nitzschia inconspicua]|uniref:PH domain containing protein n=1 Tax=Nitzschia inconspicua TaxID=303405 RepID=A0A9K3LT63_9STRA|nr:PH domain containing protein [Nitzschia inconspicua]
MSVEESSSAVAAAPTTTRERQPLHDEFHNLDPSRSASSHSLLSLHDTDNDTDTETETETEPPFRSKDYAPSPSVQSTVFRTPSSSNRRSQSSQLLWNVNERFTATSGSRTTGLSSQHHPALNSFGSPFTSPPLDTAVAGKRRSRTTKASSSSQMAMYPTIKYDFPFLSPLSDRHRNNNNGSDLPSTTRRERPEPLILDPSARSTSSTTATSSMGYSCSSSHSRSSHIYKPLSVKQQQQQQRHYHDPSSTHSSRSVGEIARSGIPSVQQLFQVATQGIRDHHATAAAVVAYNQNDDGLLHHATPSIQGINNNYRTTTASSIAAQQSSHAGFLQKLGRNIPEFKRRFFVLKPESNLYYYISPNDVEPRGKIDLEGSIIEAWNDNNNNNSNDDDDDNDDNEDGPNDHSNNNNNGDRYRFVISWPNSSAEQHHGDHPYQDSNRNSMAIQERPRRIVLEARSKEIAQEWIERMKQDRVSTLKEQVSTLTNETTAQRNRIIDLERQIEHFCMVERDRDGALEDARNWRSKFEKLDEALRLLTQQLRNPPGSTKTGEGHKDNIIESVSIEGKGEEKKEEGVDIDGKNNNNNDSISTSTEPKLNSGMDISNDTDTTPTQSNQKGAVLLDNFAQQEMNVEEMLDVPGTYFSALSNACRQQRESLRLASIEATTAVQDVIEANERVETIQKRMEKAEKQLLKLWEENCSVRKTLKQKKRERRVLVNEVKQLQSKVQKMQEEAEARNHLLRFSTKLSDGDAQMADTIIGSDEERLIDELEEHVASSIQLHERLLSGTEFDRCLDTDLNSSLDQSTSTNHSSNLWGTRDQRSTISGMKSKEGPSKESFHWGDQKNNKVDHPKLLSLLDDDSDTDSSVEDQERESRLSGKIPEELVSVAPSLSSTRAEMGDGESHCVESVASIDVMRSNSSTGTAHSTPERPNPVLELDKVDSTNEYDTSATLQIPATRVTESGRATARLACPLADVACTTKNTSSFESHNNNEELRVHHLTFYSKKIGIQFQKAPPAPVKPRGLLNDAISADLKGEWNGSLKTAAELRGVASIASLATGGDRNNGKEHCPLASPEDIVLVCGFQGFDDSGTNQRPRLGARLIAFDGVSVEVGKWTFDSIRNAIKARGRPLTLSFRNDFLTTEQRAVLTKAVMEVDAKRQPASMTVPRGNHTASAAPSIPNALSAESEHAKKNIQNRPNYTSRADVAGDRIIERMGWHNFPPSSSNSSLSSGYHDQPIRRLSSTSISTHKSNNFRSFSDTGSSVISSSFAPLMTNLLKGVAINSTEHEREATTNRFEPDYLHRQPQRSESTPQHQDFRSNLL